MAITIRGEKGSQLSHTELDENFTDLRDGIGARVPATKGATGLKVGPNGGDTYPWHDLHSTLHTDPATPATLPSFIAYQDGIKMRQFAEGDEAFIEFHLPHDYFMGSDLYIHAHWSHNSALITSGSVTWGFELSYAKGHNQAAFSATKLVTVAQATSAIQYQHMIAETAMTSLGGGATTFDNADIEPDAIVMCRVYLDSNDLIGDTTDPFLHFVDIHYQSTNVGTKNRNVDSGDFWT